MAKLTRLVGVDAARGIALIGMMAVHINPRLDAEGNVSMSYLLAGGRASALFAILAGVGLALATGGRTAPRGRALAAVSAGTVARAAVLAVIGFWLGAPESNVAVILVYYALLFVVAIPFLGLGPGILLPLAFVWVIASPMLSQLLRTGMDTEPRSVPEFGSLADSATLLTELTLTGYYPGLQWTAYILFGLGLGRLDLRSARTCVALFAGGAALAVAAKLMSSWLLASGGMEELRAAGAGNAPIERFPLEVALQGGFYGTTPTTSWWWLAVSAPHSASPFDLLHTMGVAAGVLGLMLLIATRARALLWPLAAIGSMTLTLYTLHVLLLSSSVPRETPDAFLWHVVIALAVAVPWRTFVGRGPLEAVANRASTNVRDAVMSVGRDQETLPQR
ncbi:MAG TPA: heparan-alpha-glucosaminide N-acetyltransferase domain-containing protein [Jiangellaceae bacterium]|nr:heparan-alpha-glucosaminide N-acetyltransferase domain-containing protein [Jiangellaceae bacterium]